MKAHVAGIVDRPTVVALEALPLEVGAAPEGGTAHEGHPSLEVGAAPEGDVAGDGHAAPDGDAAPEADAQLEIADLLGRTVRRLHRGTNEALAPLGLSRAQARVIQLLAGSPLRMATIADRLSVVPRTVTDLVDGVEAAGLVTRQPDPDDRRSTLVALTPDGRRLLDRLDVARRASAELLLGRLAAADRLVLLRVLRELAADASVDCAARATGDGGASTGERGDAR